MPPSAIGGKPWSYEEARSWLYARQALGIKLGLAKVEHLLAALGDPHLRFKAIHVAGTNGKGSVARLMAETLRRAGYRTGLTTSPHLVSFVERVEVDGAPISTADVAAGLARIRDAVAPLDLAGGPPTFFECVTALAFLHFADKGVQWAVVEAGMGGRLDATNVLSPQLTIITNVDLDHTAHLGPTVADIAWEKAGIMKPGVPLVTGASGQALFVLKARSHDLRVPMSVLGEDYHLVPEQEELIVLRPDGESHYSVGLAGQHQRRNAALVVAAAGALRWKGTPVPEPAVREALARTQNPGRLETIRAAEGSLGPRQVEVLIDGAHNVAAAHALRFHLGQAGFTGFHLVAGFCADKDWQEAVDQWAPLAEQVWCVPVRNHRTLDPAELAAHVAPSGIPAQVAPDAATALRLAAAVGATRILVAGSLFLAGEARAVLTGQPLEEIRGAQ
ncbi:MAG TPA: folylpolyglutamate synthase/dihydrofolate synthase family protein [Candidatus Thermoplasmatota archaeon]|nr:folylpolyglutamate synthase/dihydrofolate synthase family protein [Candidatus Thermoplasmatota archaeon]